MVVSKSVLFKTRFRVCSPSSSQKAEGGIFKKVWDTNINVNPENLAPSHYGAMSAVLHRIKTENFARIGSMTFADFCSEQKGFVMCGWRRRRFSRTATRGPPTKDFRICMCSIRGEWIQGSSCDLLDLLR